LAKKDNPGATDEAQRLDIERIKQRLNLLDQRLDNIDSVITAAVERVMSQPVTLNTTCPHCGKSIEIAFIGNHKPKI